MVQPEPANVDFSEDSADASGGPHSSRISVSYHVKQQSGKAEESRDTGFWLTSC